jgi:hypothetical protein
MTSGGNREMSARACQHNMTVLNTAAMVRLFSWVSCALLRSLPALRNFMASKFAMPNFSFDTMHYATVGAVPAAKMQQPRGYRVT